MATKRPDSFEEFQRKQRTKRTGSRLPPRTHNQPTTADRLPSLNEQRHVYVETARGAIAALRKTFETWVQVGIGLQALHDLADEIGGKQTYDRLREREGLGKNIVNKSRSSRLLAIIDKLSQVEEWRASLTDNQRFEWASPEAVHRHCPLLKPRDNAEPKPSEREQLREAVVKLEEENHRLKELSREHVPSSVEGATAALLAAFDGLLATLKGKTALEISKAVDAVIEKMRDRGVDAEPDDNSIAEYLTAREHERRSHGAKKAAARRAAEQEA